MSERDGRLELGVIADRERGQGGVLVARLPQAAEDRPVDDVRVLRPVREIEARGLAEPAALRAAAGGLDGHPVEDDAQARDDDLLREERAGESPSPGACGRPAERRPSGLGTTRGEPSTATAR